MLNNNQFFDLFLFFTFIFSFFIVVKFNESQFGGWRHLYYLYPIVIYISIKFINYFYNKIKSKKYINFLTFLIILNLSYTGYWSIKNHPYQYVFFNIFSQKYSLNNFDLDWWGLSNKNILDKILEKDKNKIITVCPGSFTSLKPNILVLEQKNRLRIISSDCANAKYIIDNKMRRINQDRFWEEKYNKYYEILVDGVAINTVYKRKN